MKQFLFFVTLSFLIFGVVGSVFAAESGGRTPLTGDAQRTPLTGDAERTQPTGDAARTPLTGQSVQNSPITIENPIEADNIQELFAAIIDILLVFAVPLIVFFIIYAGFMYVTARGNAEIIQKAHMALLYALIGGVLILGAKVLIDVISGTVDGFR